MGIEPTLFAWEARVLPLNDTREAADYRQHPVRCRVAHGHRPKKTGRSSACWILPDFFGFFGSLPFRVERYSSNKSLDTR